MLLFVYGTLRRGFDNENSRKLNNLAKWIGKAVIQNAKLYYIRGDEFDYPAMVLNNNEQTEMEKTKISSDIVIGDVFHLFNPESMFLWLDEYEECGPGNSQPTEYLRKKVKVKLIENINETNKNNELIVTTYIWNWPVKNDNGDFIPPVVERIESGDWLLHINKK
ncbi:GGACT domain-containing protein [Meloidogyne graminicola]|uniref:GGACT domain-containing protein n=1 Tax=Meloidogyne graminicola TaxID=189291 RepID=A0A8S9ZF58_9BILA|nr:GGACT domain-containing protein [Meloidogyne graminicola]